MLYFDLRKESKPDIKQMRAKCLPDVPTEKQKIILGSNTNFKEVFDIIKLRYGNTNTFFIKGEKGGLLVDTDYAGTLNAFYKSIKVANIRLNDISFVLATHYHPDHMGLISELMSHGITLLLIDTQTESVHFSDPIFEKDNIRYDKIDETKAKRISCKDSRSLLSSIGINGEIISTPSHSKDSITLITDDGNCFAGDLDPYEYTEDCEDNEALKRDWESIMYFNPKKVFYSHRPEKVFY